MFFDFPFKYSDDVSSLNYPYLNKCLPHISVNLELRILPTSKRNVAYLNHFPQFNTDGLLETRIGFKRNDSTFQ